MQQRLYTDSQHPLADDAKHTTVANHKGVSSDEFRMTTLWQEEEILRDIVDGLNAAIHEEGWDQDDLDPIKFNKLLYLAVGYFDLPITYRWYKYGSDFTPHGLSVEEGISPTAISELPSPQEPRIDPSDIEENVTPPSPAEVKSFYTTEVEEVERLFEDDTKEYLRSFYTGYAPENLEGVYSACAIFQKSLDEMGYSENPVDIIRENIETLLREIDALNREVMFCEEVADADEPFQEYVALLKDVLITVAESEEPISPRQEDVLRSVVTFFYRWAWELVSLKIASVEAKGEHGLEWKTTAGNRFLRDLERYDDELRALRFRCDRAGLIADNLLQLTVPRARSADQEEKSKREREVHRDWKGASLKMD